MAEQYNKTDVTTLATHFYKFLEGLRDGWSNEDLMNLVQTMTSAPAATNELRDDFDAAGLHITAVLADKFGDRRINEPTDEPPPA